MAMFIETVKAFDQVEWGLLLSTLEKLNIGSSFLQWIRILYRDKVARIQYAGCQSKFIKIGRGVCQGCPLSPLLFIMEIEMLVLVVRKCSEIHGILIDSVTHKMVLYVDNITFFLQRRVSLGALKKNHNIIGSCFRVSYQ